jgi:hypothetical protein
MLRCVSASRSADVVRNDGHPPPSSRSELITVCWAITVLLICNQIKQSSHISASMHCKPSEAAYDLPLPFIGQRGTGACQPALPVARMNYDRT